MLIEAKRAGHCTACGTRLVPGQEVEWDRLFGARCLPCRDARRYPERRNQRGECCYVCGLWVAPGLGVLEPKGSDGWQVRCREQLGCATRAERKARDAHHPPGSDLPS